MKHQSLDDIDSTLLSTGKVLQEFASEEKLSCLETYCRCGSIVAWLKLNTEGKFHVIAVFHSSIFTLCLSHVRCYRIAEFCHSGT